MSSEATTYRRQQRNVAVLLLVGAFVMGLAQGIRVPMLAGAGGVVTGIAMGRLAFLWGWWE